MAVGNGLSEPDAQVGALIHVCRSAWLSPAEYTFYREILLTFCAHGNPPTAADLESIAQRYTVDLEPTMQTLARQDLVQRDASSGEISAAYPLSGAPTAHRVRFDPGAECVPTADLYAMCAIDALGVPLMLRRAAWIDSQDAVTTEPVHVHVVPTAEGPLRWSTTWQPSGTAVFARPEGHEHEHDCGSSAADNCCGLTQFFTDAQHAASWSVSHPSTDGRIYTQAEALEYAATLFGGILERPTVASAIQFVHTQVPHVQLLYFAACPNTPRALEVLQRVLAAEGLPTEVELVSVETQDAADACQFYGSPTIRINGMDVSAAPAGAAHSLSCRLYRQPDGSAAHHPPAEAIADALRRAQAQADSSAQ